MNLKTGDRLLIMASIILCFSFNSTLPLHRDVSYAEDTTVNYKNLTRNCNFVEKRKRASYLENTIRKIKDTTHDFGKNIHDHINSGFKSFANKNPATDDEIRQYERMVIMKKYPYLDLRELEMKYRPMPSKNARHSPNLYFDGNFHHEPSICEAPDEHLNVEITNRGLSGFAVPVHLAKNTIEDNKLNNNVKTPVSSENSKKEKVDHVLQSFNEKGKL